MRISEQLRNLMADVPSKKPELTESTRYLFSTIKSETTKATRGRDIDSYDFNYTINEEEILRVYLEGRHAISVSNQLVKKFKMLENVNTVEAIRTKRGMKIILKPKVKE